MKDCKYKFSRRGAGTLLALLIFSATAPGAGGDGAPPAPAAPAAPPLAAALTPLRWQQVENSVDRALAWLASQQAADGSFPTAPMGQPAVTSLCVMAFLSRGHQPGYGPYGAQMERAIDFVISCQRPDGLFSYATPEAAHVVHGASHTASYNHAIAGLMLGEVYGHVTGERAKKVKAAIDRALLFTHNLQRRSKPDYDQGGWRYLRVQTPDSDLSATAWQLMFLRSARNAEFNVPQAYIDRAMGYVSRCWDPQLRMFNYSLNSAVAGQNASRGTTGAGIVALSLWLPLSGTLSSLLALPVGFAACLPFIWPELHLLLQL